MNRTERFYKIEQLLISHRIVPISIFLETLEISEATFKRDLYYLRDRMNMPIEWDRNARGYRYVTTNPHDRSSTLPGLWFTASEVHALLTMQHLLTNLGNGLLSSHITPLQTRLKALLGSADHSVEEVEKRIKLEHATRRTLPLQCFETIATATLQRQQLQITHFNRQNGQENTRIISPQQLLFYRDNWYVDAWCHLREGIRSFSIDAISHAELIAAPAIELPQPELQKYFKKGYGIFSGTKVAWAKLRFTPERARWVSTEQWHPEQKSRFDKKGYYCLEVPYSDDRELLMDILKHGTEVEVMAPKALRNGVSKLLESALAQYKT
ncbi:putative DNA-binding transcriptional regulator YafY [Candidatus Nitrotoga sp. HW29]|uniref:helix-turn-helix transcriptional regulator n=1 Tax=Candidatus Nitrotoga sp. HW29 TaxID=2886963 RepID=UPI001EF178C0|nr:WYL domain-containing protein [Candidatus Nitrotoga sp. HW29]CAH1904938.1 putative DNA-binding transcriptional regulator YafY [Candidatus Nitrotoga sp. HW29]